MTMSEAGGVAPALSADELLAVVPGLADADVAVETIDFRRLPGASLGFDDLTAVAALIRERATDFDGVVVVQGTDTIEETAYLLDLYHAGPQPVVVTGAMRNPTMAGADGPANLLAAVQTAAGSAARNLGCLVVLADEIHAARRVRKTHSTAGSTFQSPNGGAVGYVVEGEPRILSRLLNRTVVPTPVDGRKPSIPLVTVTLGDDGLLLSSVGSRAHGAVIAGFGVGHVPRHLVQSLSDLAERVPVVLASRTGAGSILTNTYGFPGSERDLAGRGLIPAGFLDAYKARILLFTLLAADADRKMIATAFAVAGGYASPEIWPWSRTDRESRG